MPPRVWRKLWDATEARALAVHLLPGDVILCKSAKDRLTTDAVYFYQSTFAPPYPRAVCDVTHAAMYVGDSHVVEAVVRMSGSGVVLEGVDHALAGRTVSIVRWSMASATDRDRIAYAAKQLCGGSYNYADVATGAWHALVKKLNLRQGSNRYQLAVQRARGLQKLSCSRVVEEAFLRGVGPPRTPISVPNGFPTPILTPADLCLLDTLDCVSI